MYSYRQQYASSQWSKLRLVSPQHFDHCGDAHLTLFSCLATSRVHPYLNSTRYAVYHLLNILSLVFLAAVVLKSPCTKIIIFERPYNGLISVMYVLNSHSLINLLELNLDHINFFMCCKFKMKSSIFIVPTCVNKKCNTSVF